MVRSNSFVLLGLFSALLLSILIPATESEPQCKARLLMRGGLSNADKARVVDSHNTKRQLLAMGKIPNYVGAMNMLEMSWDEELQKEAQEWANTCSDTVNPDRNISRFAYGQNIASSSDSHYDGGLPDFEGIIDQWFSEHTQFSCGEFCFQYSNHFTQIIWATSYLIGCGYSYSFKESSYMKLYVCNYGPAVDLVGAPYMKSRLAVCKAPLIKSTEYNGLCKRPNDTLSST